MVVDRGDQSVTNGGDDPGEGCLGSWVEEMKCGVVVVRNWTRVVLLDVS